MESLPPTIPQEYSWTVDTSKAVLMNLVSLLLCPIGLFLFLNLARVMRPAYTFVFVLPDKLLYDVLALAGILLSCLLLLAVIFLFHEWCHGLAYRWVGVKPQYGAKLVKRIMPILYTTGPGAWLTKSQYLLVALTPTVLVNLVGIALMWPPTVLRDFLILPLVANFCGCIGDWWMAAVILKLPAGTMFEDNLEGFRYRYANTTLS